MLNIRFATDYLMHRLRAKNRHGVHSPFVYRLVDTIIYGFNGKKVYTEVENIRKHAIAGQKITTIISPK